MSTARFFSIANDLYVEAISCVTIISVVMFIVTMFCVSDVVPISDGDVGTIVVLLISLVITGFYPKLKSFWSCSHMNCGQQNILHINFHILYIYFVEMNQNLKELQEFIKYI